jgi:hypothetical protein
MMMSDFCMDPTTFAISFVPDGTAQDIVQYYSTCTGESLSEQYLYNAQYAAGMLDYFASMTATTCPGDASVIEAIACVQHIETSLTNINSIAECEVYLPYWNAFFHQGLCTEVFHGLYTIWITQSLTAVFLFLSCCCALLVAPYFVSLTWSEEQRLEESHHHRDDEVEVVLDGVYPPKLHALEMNSSLAAVSRGNANNI